MTAPAPPTVSVGIEILSVIKICYFIFYHIMPSPIPRRGRSGGGRWGEKWGVGL